MNLAKECRERDLVENLNIKIENIQTEYEPSPAFERIDPALNNPEIEQILIQHKRNAEEKNKEVSKMNYILFI